MNDSESPREVATTIRIDHLEESLNEQKQQSDRLRAWLVRSNAAMAAIIAVAAVLGYLARSSIASLRHPEHLVADSIDVADLNADRIEARKVVLSEGQDGPRIEIAFIQGSPTIRMFAAGEKTPRIALGLSPAPGNPNAPALLLSQPQDDGSRYATMLGVGKDVVASLEDPTRNEGRAGAQLMFFELSDRAVQKTHAAMTYYPSKGASLQLLAGDVTDAPELRASLSARVEDGGMLSLYGEGYRAGAHGPIAELLAGSTTTSNGDPSIIIHNKDGQKREISLTEVKTR